MASAAASPTATAAAITTTVATAIAATISASVTAAPKILAGTVATAASGIVLRGIVMRREVLRRGSIGIRLAFLSRFGVLIFHGSGRNRVVMLLEMLVFSGVRFIVRSVLLIRVMSFVLVELFVVHFFVVITDPAQGFTWKQFDRG